MSVELNREVCAMCGVRLTDVSSAVENEGQIYCCGNCLANATQPALQSAPVREACANCGLPLIDPSSRVQRGFQVYCCNNCANAFERTAVGRPAE